jgi:hypothetical protein
LKTMSSKIMRKRVLIPLGIVILATAGAAYAYFSAVGTGSGSATTGSSAALTLHGTVASAIYPGGTSSVTFTVDNPSGGKVRVGTITLAGVTTDGSHVGCSMSDFSMPNVVANQDVASGNGVSVSATGTLVMANSATNQDACQGAPLTLHLVSN